MFGRDLNNKPLVKNQNFIIVFKPARHQAINGGVFNVFFEHLLIFSYCFCC